MLDGTINVTVPAGGAFDVGVYRVFNYGGTLTNNGLTLGTLPVGSDVAVQTSIAGQVNLVNSAGLTLNFWDGAAGPKNNGVINGGDGIWQNSTGNDNWTDATGTVNAAYSRRRLRGLRRHRRHGDGRQWPRPGHRGGHAVRRERLHDRRRPHRTRPDRSRSIRVGDGSAAGRRLHRDDQRGALGRHPAGQDRCRHARARRHQQLYRRHA